jgi:hypothetical protein
LQVESFLKHQIKPVLMEKFSGLLTDEEMAAEKDLRTYAVSPVGGAGDNL